jgi:hypothetical protein
MGPLKKNLTPIGRHGSITVHKGKGSAPFPQPRPGPLTADAPSMNNYAKTSPMPTPAPAPMGASPLDGNVPSPGQSQGPV